MREMGINRKNEEVKEGCDTASQPSFRIYRYAVISRQSRCGRLRCYLLSFAFIENACFLGLHFFLGDGFFARGIDRNLIRVKK